MDTTHTFGSFAVTDIAATRTFYAETLGLDVTSEQDPAGGEVLWIRGPGGGTVLAYAKPDHTPAGFTVYNLEVDDIVRAAEDLSGSGVGLERYEGMPSDDRGIVRMGGHAVAWFTDPSGNVLALMQRTG